MNILGFFIILSALVITGWWVLSNHKYKGWAVTVCILALFAGTLMLLQDRVVEVSLKGVGTIKAAAEKAITDAAAIADVKKRVEAQSVTVDLVAKSASEAKSLVTELKKKSKKTKQELARLDKTMNKASSTLETMEKTAELATTILSAQTDDWGAFSQLQTWSEDKSYPFRQIVASAYVKVRLSYAERITSPGYLNIIWNDGIDPSALSLTELEKAYTTLNPLYHPHLVNIVWKREDIPKRSRMEFLVQILRNGESLCAKYFAGKFFVSGAGDNELKWQPFQIEPLLQWWKDNADSIKKS